MWNPRKKRMRLNDDVKEVRRAYEYCPRGRNWAVYLRVTYRRGESFPPDTFSTGDKVSEFLTREEARREVYRLNGWRYRERRGK